MLGCQYDHKQIRKKPDRRGERRWVRSGAKDEEIPRTFYVEPVTYRDDPRRLDGWISFFDTFAGRSHAHFESVLAADKTVFARSAALPHFSSASFLRKTAVDLGETWCVVPQWHTAFAPPSAALIEHLTATAPNIAAPPEALRMSMSEHFLPWSDHVVTVSSNVAALAAIIGKPVTVAGRSKFSGLQRHPPSERMDLLAFFASRYCIPLDECLATDRVFAQRVLDLAREPESPLRLDATEPDDLQRFLA
jgi:hypothetical protein